MADNQGVIISGIPMTKCQKHFKEYQETQKIYTYTDDTAMARSVADSIISMRSVYQMHVTEKIRSEKWID